MPLLPRRLRTNNDPPDENTSAAAPTGMSKTFASKSRRARFEVRLRIVDLNNVPLVSGTSFIKWHLPSSTAAEHRGKTNKCAIRDHRVAYEYEKTVAVRLTVGKDGMLQECSVHFEVLQEYSAGGRGERIRLGDVKLNLAEYVDASEAPTPITPGAGNEGSEEGVVRRYLMQDSKINSTLKLGILMRHVEGTRDYYAPPLRTAPVFGGIAGIIQSGEPASATSHIGGPQANGDVSDAQEAQPPANLTTTNKEVGEMQDMYRRTLAAFWASSPGELKADDCIEDIFAGGDGWGKAGRPASTGQDGTNFGVTNSRPGSGTSTPNVETEATTKMGHAGREFMKASAGRHRRDKHADIQRKPRKSHGEVDENDVREDLRSWTVSEIKG